MSYNYYRPKKRKSRSVVYLKTSEGRSIKATNMTKAQVKALTKIMMMKKKRRTNNSTNYTPFPFLV